MSNVLVLSSYIGKTIYRDKTVVGLTIFLPILLIVIGAVSAPNREIQMVLDKKLLQPNPDSLVLNVALNTITAIILVSSLVSFFLGFNLKSVVPRLRQANYSNLDIVLSFVFVTTILNIALTMIIGIFSFYWISVNSYFGYFIGLFLGSIIFSTLGLIIAEFTDTITLGLYLVITIAVLDTAFLENPLFSRRYNDPFIHFMPAHATTQMIFRTIFETGKAWFENIYFILIYQIFLMVIYAIILKYKKPTT